MSFWISNIISNKYNELFFYIKYIYFYHLEHYTVEALQRNAASLSNMLFWVYLLHQRGN